MKFDRTYIDRYCQSRGRPVPEIVVGKPTAERGQAAAECFRDRWGFVLNEALAEVGERTLIHETAHLFARENDAADSRTHGPKFMAQELEIENFVRDERRRDIRGR